MSTEEQIRRIIEETLAPEHFELINESNNHVGHAGHDGSGDSHFNLMVVSKSFEGYSRIQRHRMVTKNMDSLFDKGLHALSLNLKTPSEAKLA